MFNCMVNDLKSLEHGPINVGTYPVHEGGKKYPRGTYNCSYNYLTNLVGAPKGVGSFNCASNNIVSLEGIPEEIDGNFNLIYNPGKFDKYEIMKLTRLAGQFLIQYH